MNDLKQAYMQRRLQGEAPETIWRDFWQSNEEKLGRSVEEMVAETTSAIPQLKEATLQWHAMLQAQIPGKEEGDKLVAIGERINEIAIDSLELGGNISKLEEAQHEVTKARKATVKELQDLQVRAKQPVSKKSPIPGGWLESKKPSYNASGYKGAGK